MWIELDPHNNPGIIPHGSPREIDQFEADMARDTAIAEQMAAVGIHSNAERFGEAVVPAAVKLVAEAPAPCSRAQVATVGHLALAS